MVGELEKDIDVLVECWWIGYLIFLDLCYIICKMGFIVLYYKVVIYIKWKKKGIGMRLRDLLFVKFCKNGCG